MLQMPDFAEPHCGPSTDGEMEPVRVSLDSLYVTQPGGGGVAVGIQVSQFPEWCLFFF